MKKHILIIIVFIVVALASSFYSMSHFSDGGCDGGTCAILLIAHTLPLLIVWLLFYISFAQSLKHRKWMFLPLIMGLALNTLVISQGFGYRQDELYTEPILLFIVAAICIIIYFFGEQLGLIKTESAVEKSHVKINNIMWFWYIILGSYSIYTLYYFGKTLYVLIRWPELQEHWLRIFITSILMNGLRITAIIFMLKKAKWSFALFALLVLFNLFMQVLNSIDFDWSWPYGIRMVLNVAILIATAMYYRRVIK